MQLNIELGGSVLSVSLSYIVYVRHCNEGCLISYTKIHMVGRFGMVGVDGAISDPRKSEHSAVCIAELMHECHQVLPLTRHQKINTTGTHFWYQGLGLSSTRF